MNSYVEVELATNTKTILLSVLLDKETYKILLGDNMQVIQTDISFFPTLLLLIRISFHI